MKALDKAGVLDEADENAREALKVSLEIMRLPIDHKVRLSAARQVLDFTKAKPALKQDLTIHKAEEWLEAVTQDNNGETDEGTDSGAEAPA